MANVHFAPVVEYANIAAGATQTFGSGENFRVNAIYLSTETTETAIATIETVAGATMVRINIIAGEMESIEIPFIADAGLKITATTNNIHATVLRDHAGT